MRISVLIYIFVFSCFVKLSAQDTSNLGEVLILSDRIQQPFSKTNRNITIITAAEISKLPVKSVQELLGWVSGVDVRQRGPFGGQSDISLMGGTFEQTLLLVDGVRMIDPQTGHNMMNIPIPLEAIERVEVLKGAAARIYGLNALTGAINIVTRKCDKDFISGRLYTGSSFDKDTSNGKTYGNMGLGISAGVNRGKVNQVFSAGVDKGNGYRHNTAYEAYRLYNRTSIALKSSEILLTGGYVNNSFGANAFYAAPGDKESTEKVETGTASAKWIKKTGKYTIIPEISWRYNYDHYIYIRQKPTIYQNRHFTHSISPGLHVTRTTSYGQYSLGLEHRYDNIRSNNLGNRERNNTGVSAEFLYNKYQKFYGLAGVYLLNNSAFGTGIFPGIEVGYEWYQNTKVFFNAGTAQRIPSFTDLYYKGPSNTSNPNLKPENSTNMELGMRYNRKNLYLQASAVIRDIDQLIDWVKDSISAPWSPVNYNTTRTYGFDMNLRYRFLQSANLKGSMQAGYTFLQPAFINEVNKNYSKNVLENLNQQAIATVLIQYRNKLSLNLSGRYIVRNTMNAYTLLDVHLDYAVKGISIFTDITNLTDTKYREIATVPMTPRWVTLGIRVNTANFKK